MAPKRADVVPKPKKPKTGRKALYVIVEVPDLTPDWLKGTVVKKEQDLMKDPSGGLQAFVRYREGDPDAEKTFRNHKKYTHAQALALVKTINPLSKWRRKAPPNK